MPALNWSTTHLTTTTVQIVVGGEFSTRSLVGHATVDTIGFELATGAV